MQMPEYKSHKTVQALRIEEVRETDAGAEIHFLGSEHPCVHVDADWIHSHKPAAGGYFVRYNDGYTSYSPAKAFEEGYTLLSLLET